jgi:type VI secretion system ImpA family protein
VNVEALVAPLSDEEGAKAGPDLGYSDARSAIEAPFQLDANGGEVETGAWRDSIKAIVAQAEETRDLWLAVYLARAGAKAGDLQVVADGAEMLAGLLEGLWDEVHPTLEEADFVGRKTPCDSLTKIREFLAPLKRVTVFEHRQGKVSGEDLERFAVEGGGAEGYAQFRGAIDSNDPERKAEVTDAFAAAVAKLDAIRDALQRADAVLVAHAGSDTGTNFTPTYEALASLRSAVAPYAGIADEADSDYDGDSAHSGEPSRAASAGGPALSGTVNSREDVLRAIDAITDYYKAREPGSPVPVLMRRARHWVGMDFLQVLDDLVPDSIADAKRVLVSKVDEPAAEESDY